MNKAKRSEPETPDQLRRRLRRNWRRRILPVERRLAAADAAEAAVVKREKINIRLRVPLSYPKPGTMRWHRERAQELEMARHEDALAKETEETIT